MILCNNGNHYDKILYTAVIAKKEEIKIAKNAFNSYAAETVGTVQGHSLQWIRYGGCLCVEEKYIVVVIER